MDVNLIKSTAHKFDAKRFYDLLFTRYPQVRSMFVDDMTNHYKIFTNTVIEVIANLDNFDAIKPKLRSLGRRHASIYDVKSEQYALVGPVLLDSLELETKEQTEAWTAAYTAIVDTMLETVAKEPVSGQG